MWCTLILIVLGGGHKIFAIFIHSLRCFHPGLSSLKVVICLYLPMKHSKAPGALIVLC